MAELAKELKLGICSDTHGDMPRWDGAALDAVLVAGDVYDAFRHKQAEDCRYLRQWVEARGVPVLAVRGNHDFQDLGGFFQAAEDISGRLYHLGPELWVAGVGFASKHYYDLPGQSDLEPQCGQLLRTSRRLIMPRQRVILLTHYAPDLPELPDLPAGEARTDWMYRCVADLVEKLHPIAIVLGHVHHWFGRQWRRADGSLIVSPGSVGGILSISEDGQAAFEASAGS